MSKCVTTNLGALTREGIYETDFETLTRWYKLGIKGNMHHKYDVSLKDAFYIIDLATGIFC